MKVINHTPSKRHTVVFYNSKDELLDILVPYFKAGLENNEFCIWITSELLNVEDAKMALSKAVKDFDCYIKKGQIEIGDYKDYYFKSGGFTSYEVLKYWSEKEKDILKQGFSRMRVSGDATWGVEDSCWISLEIYEKDINEIIEEHQMIAICTYNTAKLKLKQIKSIGINHQASLVKQMGEWRSIQPSHFHNISA